MKKRSFLFYTVVSLCLVLIPNSLTQASVRSLQNSQQANLRQFQLISADQGWAILGDKLFWTNDNGATWSDISPEGEYSLRTVHFYNSDAGWAVFTQIDTLMHYYLAATHNGGISWQTTEILTYSLLDPDAVSSAVHLFFLDQQTGWLTLKRATSTNFDIGLLFQTSDGGKTWQQRTAPGGGPVKFIDPQLGWTDGGPDGSALYRTANGGKTWQTSGVPVYSGQRARYLLPMFMNRSSGFLPVLIDSVGSSDLFIYRTTDQGKSWELFNGIPIASESGLNLIHSPTAHKIIFGLPETLLVYDSTSNRFAPTNTGINLNIAALQMANAQDGWAQQYLTSCASPRDCTNSVVLIKTEDGGRHWQPIDLPPVLLDVPDFPANSDLGRVTLPLVSRTSILQGQGFDKCAIGTANQMQTWKENSPYSAANLYIGGKSLYPGCDSGLTSELIETLSKQGWKFILTWVGPQASCTNFSTTMSPKPSTAEQQGRDNATDALNVAHALGFTEEDLSGTIIYYDLEAFNTEDAGCLKAAKRFINGWVEVLKAKGNMAGLYGSVCASALAEFSTIDNKPDALWPAIWYEDAYSSPINVWNLPCLDDTQWGNHQRILQYAGTHTETWGGVSLTIDNDVLDGIVADLSKVVGVPSSTISNPSFETGSLASWKVVQDNAACTWSVANLPEIAQEGSYLMQISKSALQTNCQGINQDITLSPQVGQQYRFAIWTRSASAAYPRTATISISGIGASVDSNSITFSGITDRWVCLESVVSITQNGQTGLRVAVDLENSDGRAIYLDSAHISLNTASLCPRLIPPTNPKASEGTFTEQIALTWDAVPLSTYYKIYRSASLSETAVKIGTSTDTDFSDTAFTPSAAYYYWIKACDASGCSVASEYTTGFAGASSIIMVDGFETGDFSSWSSVYNPDKLVQCAAATVFGDYGLCVRAYPGEIKFTSLNLVNPGNTFEMDFFFNPNNISIGSETLTLLTTQYQNSRLVPFTVQVSQTENGYRIRLGGNDNTGNWFFTQWYQIKSQTTKITVNWSSALVQARSAVNAAEISLSINDVHKETISGIANNELLLDSIRFGLIDPIKYPQASGIFYLDHFELHAPPYYRFERP